MKMKLPWLIPGIRRPNFRLYRIKIGYPTELPANFALYIILLGVLFIYSGGMYDLVEKPISIGSDQYGEPSLISQSLDRQFMLEGIVAAIFMFFGALGLYLMDYATGDPHNVRSASTLQALGIVISFISFLTLILMLEIKT